MKFVLDAVFYSDRRKKLVMISYSSIAESNSLDSNVPDQLYENITWRLRNFCYL